MGRHKRTRDLVTDIRQREGYLLTQGYEMLADDDLDESEAHDSFDPEWEEEALDEDDIEFADWLRELSTE